MNKKELLVLFVNELKANNLLTKFIKNIFDYKNFNDYNYIFRMQENDTNIIIDIYDNISNNRFNRYIFSFTTGKYDMIINENNNIYVYMLNVFSMNDSENKLKKLAYLFKLDNDEIIEYANSFLNPEIVTILDRIIKESNNK